MKATSPVPTILSLARRPALFGQCVLLALSGAAVADSELPTAQALLAAHIEAVGGEDVLNRQFESTTTGRFVMPAAGLEGTVKVFSRMPVERAVSIDLPDIGTIQSGYKDRSAWAVDPFMGPRLVTGAELDIQIESNEPGALFRSDEFVESMRTTEIAEYDGESCYKVFVKWKTGRESTDCYSTESGYLIATEFTVESPMGEVETTTVFTDYTVFESDGVELKLPATTVVTTMGQAQQLLIDSIELGAPADEHFALPPAIKTLKEDAQAD